MHEACWRLDSHDPELAGPLVDEVVAWVQASMAKMRRPYGIDHVALALAARNTDGKVVCSNSIGVVRPQSFYDEAGPEQVRAFLADAATAMEGRPGEVVGALLSLGDIAYELRGKAA